MSVRRLILLLFICFPILSWSQESALDKVTQKTCECMSAKDISKMERSVFEQELGLCMLTSATPFMADLEKEEGISATDQAGLTTLGEKVGGRLAMLCPDLLQKMMSLYADDNTVETKAEVLKMEEGAFVSVSQGQFAQVELKGADGIVRGYYWLEAFDGSESLQGNASEKVGQMLQVTYQDRSFYDPQSGGYKNVKVIRSISWK